MTLYTRKNQIVKATKRIDSRGNKLYVATKGEHEWEMSEDMFKRMYVEITKKEIK